MNWTLVVIELTHAFRLDWPQSKKYPGWPLLRRILWLLLPRPSLFGCLNWCRLRQRISNKSTVKARTKRKRLTKNSLATTKCRGQNMHDSVNSKQFLYYLFCSLFLNRLAYTQSALRLAVGFDFHVWTAHSIVPVETCESSMSCLCLHRIDLQEIEDF